MTRKYRTHALCLLAVFALTMGACSKREEPAPAPAAPAPVIPAPVAVDGVDLGNQIGADKTVATPLDTFKRTDTIYASVRTTGASSNATLVARWTYGAGQKVSEDSRAIAPTGPAVTEFHISKPSGWPKGKYQVEILLDGVSKATKTFTVN